jgi:hypothetical protein
MLAVLLLCVPPPLEPVERPITFASLTPAQAAVLSGKLQLHKVVLDSAGTEHGGRVGDDAAHDDEPGSLAASSSIGWSGRSRAGETQPGGSALGGWAGACGGAGCAGIITKPCTRWTGLATSTTSWSK